MMLLLGVVGTLVGVQVGMGRRASRALQRRLSGHQYPAVQDGVRRRINRWLAELGLEVDADQVVGPTAVVLAGVSLGGWMIVGPLGVVTALVIVALALVMAAPWSRRRADAVVDRALPALLESIARSLRSGATLAGALTEARSSMPTPMAADLATIEASGELGQPLSDALARWTEQRPSPEVALVAAALAFTDDYGAAQAEAMDGLAASFRARRQVEREIKALASQAQVSAAVMSLLPAGFVVVGLAADSASAAFLVSTPVGRLCLAVGVALDVAGLGWMRQVASRVVH